MNGAVETAKVGVAAEQLKVTLLLHEHLLALVGSDDLKVGLFCHAGGTNDLTLAKAELLLLTRLVFE